MLKNLYIKIVRFHFIEFQKNDSIFLSTKLQKISISKTQKPIKTKKIQRKTVDFIIMEDLSRIS